MTADPTVPCVGFNHLNVVVEDFDGTLSRLRRLLGAQFISDMPHAELHAGLVYFAGVIVELFSPAQPLLTARYGDHYVGIEYQIAGDEIDPARQAVLARGVRIIRDIGAAFHTHPVDCHGIDFEFYTASFYTGSQWQWLEPFHSRRYWENEHPLGIRGMLQYTVTVGDLEAATDFLQGFVGAVPASAALPSIPGTRTRTFTVADTTVELVSPTAAGPARDHLDRYGDGISGIVLNTVALPEAQRFLVESDAAGRPGDRPGSVVFDLSPRGGLRCELVQV